MISNFLIDTTDLCRRHGACERDTSRNGRKERSIGIARRISYPAPIQLDLDLTAQNIIPSSFRIDPCDLFLVKRTSATRFIVHPYDYSTFSLVKCISTRNMYAALSN